MRTSADCHVWRRSEDGYVVTLLHTTLLPYLGWLIPAKVYLIAAELMVSVFSIVIRATHQ